MKQSGCFEGSSSDQYDFVAWPPQQCVMTVPQDAVSTVSSSQRSEGCQWSQTDSATSSTQYSQWSNTSHGGIICSSGPDMTSGGHLDIQTQNNLQVPFQLEQKWTGDKMDKVGDFNIGMSSAQEYAAQHTDIHKDNCEIYSCLEVQPQLKCDQTIMKESHAMIDACINIANAMDYNEAVLPAFEVGQLDTVIYTSCEHNQLTGTSQEAVTQYTWPHLSCDVLPPGAELQHYPLYKPRRKKRIINCQQRKAANIRERKRMCNLNQAFQKLQTRVPTFAFEKKLSRMETLTLAIRYISFMTELINDDNEEKDRGDTPKLCK